MRPSSRDEALNFETSALLVFACLRFVSPNFADDRVCRFNEALAIGWDMVDPPPGVSPASARQSALC
eukprot:2786392-Pleurochrysis_carterae.AAC.2